LSAIVDCYTVTALQKFARDGGADKTCAADHQNIQDLSSE
jgi:hypothetical protein